MQVPVRKQGKVSGFTLVEMAIVLVIIGIILAGVMKGRDIVRGAQVKQFSQQFAQKWATVAQTYYDKTGQQLNDGTVNGGTGTNPDGLMDGTLASDTQTALILPVLTNVGITPCTLIKSKLVATLAGVAATAGGGTVCQDNTPADVMNIWQTTVDGEFAGSQVVEVDLVSILLTVNNAATTRNCLVLYNVPTDVAQGLDTAIDGTANGVSGNCVALSAGYSAAIGAATQITAPTDGGGPATAVTAVAWAAASDVGANEAQSQDVGIILDF